MSGLGRAREDPVIIVGGGAAGLVAAARAASLGAPVAILERGREAGRKLLISGKGRCNVTHQAGVQALVEGFPGNGRFLFSALNAFGPDQLREHLAGLGVETKVERGNRVFPSSGEAASVRDALLRDATGKGAVVHYGERAAALVLEPGAGGLRQAVGVRTAAGRLHRCRAIVLATGGLSYPGTGSTGDGHRMAADAGHTIVETAPSLVPLVTEEAWPSRVTGLGLRNVRFRAWAGGEDRRPLADEFGELLFTHFGLSGPIVLRASRAVSRALASGAGRVRCEIDLKPALAHDVLDRRLQRDFQAQANRQFRNSLRKLMPSSLASVLVSLSGIDPERRVREVTRQERLGLAGLIKALPLSVVATRGFSEAIVTSGGVDVREVSPGTMESRLVRGLFFAGEVLDVDGYTGGFNLQAAFSTGYLAGGAATGLRTGC